MDTQPAEQKTAEIPPKPEPSVHKNASWGAIISIVVILAMIVVGAFYAWGKRVAEQNSVSATSPASKT